MSRPPPLQVHARHLIESKCFLTGHVVIFPVWAFARRCPDLRVLGCVIRRGSLLAAVSVVPSRFDGDGEGAQHCSTAVQLGCVKPAQWLQWLGLPSAMEITAQVVNHPDQRASCLSSLPLVVILPADALSIALNCGTMQPGQSVRASYDGAAAVVASSTHLSNPMFSSAAAQSPCARHWPGVGEGREHSLVAGCWSLE